MSASNDSSHPTFSSIRRRRRAAMASVLFVAAASSCASFLDVGSPVDAFTSPSTKAVFLHQQHHRHQHMLLTPLHSTSRRAVASNSDVTSTRRGSSGGGSGLPPGSPLEMICMDQHEFELQVGHAMDTLRDDYPHILTKNPGA